MSKIPLGLCQCGCGKESWISKRTRIAAAVEAAKLVAERRAERVAIAAAMRSSTFSS